MKNKIEVYEKVMAGRVVAILRKIDVTKAVPLAKALLDGGITAMEVTMDTPGATTAIEQIKKALGKSVAIGAGTVLDPETGRVAMLAGAQFLVAPNLNLDVIKLGNRYGKMVMPGVFTPSEIEQAYEAGADVVKIFPASVVGSSFFKQVKGPLDHITMMATGGIGIDNVQEYRANGADVIGAGGKLVDKQAIAEDKFEVITEYARQLVELAK